MTEEELEKEVEEYLENKHCKNVCIRDEIKECKEGIRIRCMAFEHRKQLIVDFAEPREKQIEIDAEQIRALQKQNGELTDKVKELEAQIEKMKSDVIKSFGDEYNVLVAKLLKEWEIKEK